MHDIEFKTKFEPCSDKTEPQHIHFLGVELNFSVCNCIWDSDFLISVLVQF